MEDDDDVQTLSSQSTSRSPSSASSACPPSSSPHRSNGSIEEAVGVAASSLRIQQPRSSSAPAGGRRAGAGGGGGGGGGGREDCWSEDASYALIDAWGERYLELSSGYLKQKQWQEVADVVASREGCTRTSKTPLQCKNRMDTLKKKYKIEKSMISSGSSTSSSSWPFFHRLDLLLGPTHKPSLSLATPSSSSKIPAGVPFHLPQSIPQRQRSSPVALTKARSSLPSASSMSAGSSDGFLPPPRATNGKPLHQKTPMEKEDKWEARAAGLRELTLAIDKFAEVYERVASSKLRLAMEIQKQRMEFTRELQLQSMEFLMKTQIELTQLKGHLHNHGGNSKKRGSDNYDGDDAGGSGNHMYRYRHHNNVDNNGSNSNDNGKNA